MAEIIAIYDTATAVPGLLALYLCTRNCCGVILNLFFSSAAVGCGVGLYLSGFSRSLGIMFIIVGLLMMVVIILALIYHKFTGELSYKSHLICDASLAIDCGHRDNVIVTFLPN